MRSLDNSDFIMAGTKIAQSNTWQNRYNKTIPNIIKEGETIKLTYSDIVSVIDSFDEIVLTIIMKFLFCPLWLIKKFYSCGSIVGYEDYCIEKVEGWVKLGLVWKESSVTGLYLRPTYALFELFGEKPYRYTNIPFNMLTHTICEEWVMFTVMYGNSEIVEQNRGIILPRISELGFRDDKHGTNIIAEEDFRNPKLYTQEGIDDLIKTERSIEKAMREKSQISDELTDFRQFILSKKIANTGSVKKDYIFHVPDLIIVNLRDKGLPQSIAIEVELTNKRSLNYEETMKRYKDNNKYGSVYWLCSEANTLKELRDAYRAVGGTGSCKMKLLEFEIPVPEF